MSTKLTTWSTSSGRITLELSIARAKACLHSGPCDNDVMCHAQASEIKCQLDSIDNDTLISELEEYGAWTKEELQAEDRQDNLERLLWIACGDVMDDEREKHNKEVLQ